MRLLDQYGNALATPKRRRRAPPARAGLVRARYDLAQTTEENAAHWGAADALDADTSNLLPVRKRMRERARYEDANNPALTGICSTEADYEIGTGPTLQLLTSSESFNAMIETRFSHWARAVNLAGKLWVLARARVVDGESFALLTANPAVEDPVKLDVRPIECDQFSSAYAVPPAENYVDGIRLDAWGNAIAYDCLRRHPGAGWPGLGSQAYDTYPASLVLHWFRPTRPGQHRGVSEIHPGLSLLPGVRRMNRATVKAVEVAADLALAVETEALAGNEPDEIEPGAAEIPMGSMFHLPYGSKAHQVRSEHPNGQYGDFVDRNHGMAARPLSMPQNIATGDSSKYNFASGQLDHLTFFAAIGIKQKVGCDHAVMQKIFAAWFREAVWVYQWNVPDRPAPEFQCSWSGRPFANVADEANATQANLADGATTLPLEYSRRGLDCDTELKKGAAAYGVSLEQYQALLRLKTFGTAETGDRGQGTGDREQGTGDREQGTGDREQGTGERGSQLPTALNGAQITAAIDVLVKLREEILQPAAAEELLSGIGVERAKAAAIVKATPVGLDNRAGDVAFKRQILQKLLEVPAAREAVYNATDIEDLVSQTGLAAEKEYEVPWIPVVAPQGQLVSGATIEDADGDTVGGDVVKDEGGSEAE